MTIKNIRLAALAALCFALPAIAADTGPAEPAPAPAASASTRAASPLANARKAIEAKSFETAIEILTAHLASNPADADAENLLGFSYRKLAKPDLAKSFEHYAKCFKINPNHVGAHEYIGEAYLMDKKPAEAQKHLAALEKICGKDCPEYKMLFKSIADYLAGRPSTGY
jgi:Flp pilus assembly protein TadD